MNPESVVAEALRKLTPDERAAYLDRACAGQEGLRAQVEALLQTHSADASVMEPTLAPSSAPSAEAGRLSPEGPGTRIGRYKLLQRLGEGGMGTVYMAEQEEPVRRTVALKIIKPGMDTDEVITRFEAERQALAIMDHQNIARVLDAGTTDAGRPFFVMELVRGVPITKFCDDHHLTTRERLELFIPVCQALQHAHQKGIIHRDVKPSNVLVATHDDRPVPKVIDFGVAKAMGQRLTDKTMFTQFGQVVGTLEYMSPEQAEMGALDIDTRSDVYSLGVLLYELLTGSTPIDSKKLRKAAILEMLRLIQEVEPPPPSSRLTSSETLASIAAQRKTEPQRLCRLVQGDLDWIVMRALEKDRTRRYATAFELAGDIERHLSDQPVLACPPSVAYQVSKFVRRNRGMVVTATALLAALVLGLVSTTYLYFAADTAQRAEAEQRAQAVLERDHATESERVAESQRREAEQARDEANTARQAEAEQRKVAERRRLAAEAVNRFLTTDMLTASDPERALGREITVQEVLDSAAGTVSDAFQDQPEIEAAVRVAIGKTYFSLAKFPAAEEQLAKSLALSTEVLGSTHEDTLNTAVILAGVYQKSGKLQEAEEAYRKALDAWQTHFGDQHTGTLVARSDLAILLHFRGKSAEAESLMRKVVAQLPDDVTADHPVATTALNNLALLLLERGAPLEAEPLARRAVTVAQAKYGDKHPNTLTNLNTLGRTLQALSRLDEALPLLRQVLEQRRLIQGKNHLDTLTAMSNLGSALQALGQMDEAEPLYREALAGFRQLHGNEHLNTVALINNLATFYAAKRDFPAAEPLFRETRLSLIKLVGSEHPMSLLVANNLAYVLTNLKRIDEAEALLRETLVAQERLQGKQHPGTLQTMQNLGDTLREQHKWDESEALLRTALATRRATLPATHPEIANVLALLGSMFLEKGDAKEAETHLREAFAVSQTAYPQGHASIGYAQCLLGGALAAQDRFEEAEPLLIGGFETMEKSKTVRPDRLRLAKERIVSLYEAWNKPQQAEQWRAKSPRLDLENPAQL